MSGYTAQADMPHRRKDPATGRRIGRPQLTEDRQFSAGKAYK